MIQIICLLIQVFHNDIICSTECYDPQYQKPSEGQQKYNMHYYVFIIASVRFNRAYEVE